MAACCLLVNKDVPTAGVPVLRHLCHGLPQRLMGSRAAPCLDIALSLEMEGWRQSGPGQPLAWLSLRDGALPGGGGVVSGRSPQSALPGKAPSQPTALRSTWPGDMGSSLLRLDVACGLCGPWQGRRDRKRKKVGRRWRAGWTPAGSRLAPVHLLLTFPIIISLSPLPDGLLCG